jgi:hypothetical protein
VEAQVANGTVLWLSLDEFGQELRSLCCDLAPTDTAQDVLLAAPPGPGSVVVVAASWEPARELAAVSDAAIANDFALVPVVVNPIHLRVGPIVAGAAARCCYHCFAAMEQKRNASNKIGTYLRAVRSYADNSVLRRIAGHTAAHAYLGAGIIDEGVSDPAGHDAVAWYSSHDGADLRMSRFEGVDGCRRCGVARDDRTTFEGTSWT